MKYRILNRTVKSLILKLFNFTDKMILKNKSMVNKKATTNHLLTYKREDISITLCFIFATVS